MVKILFVITKKDVGGAQKYVNDLVENLDPKQFRVRVLTGGRGGARFLFNTVAPYAFFLNDCLALVELFFIFRREKPDIVHLNSSKAGVIGALAAWLYNVTSHISHVPDVKVIFTAHGWVFNPDNKLNFLERRFYIFLHKLAGCFQDKIINVSEYDRNLALRHKIAAPEKLITVYNGIDHGNLKFLDKTAARKALSKMIEPMASHQSRLIDIWIGSVGRLVAEKDYKTLAEAVSLVPNANFFIIGSGPEYNKLKVKSKKLKISNRFFILENLAPAVPYLKAFNLFVLPSIKEGLPYTILEAMSAELPIIVTRVGGMTELIENRGMVMPPREPKELARAINYFLENPDSAKNLARKANEFLKDKFTLKRMVRETSEVYLSNV